MMRIKTLKTNNGFTLIEALVAMVILSLGIFSLYSMQTTSIKGNSKASLITTATVWNADQVERVIGMQYLDTPLQDTDGDGDGVSMDSDGNDTNSVNFGLDDIDPATADGNFVTSDSHYTVYWNVAIDVPMADVKTIRVHVVDTRQVLGRPVTFTYLKNDSM